MTQRSFTSEAAANRPRRPGERGAALVEFALVLPVLLLILFGIVDFAKAFNYWNDSTHLANEAARFAAVNNWPTKGSQTLQDYIQGQADTKELRTGGSTSVKAPLEVCVHTIPDTGAGPGDSVQVLVKVDYTLMKFLGTKLKPLPSVQSTSTMRLETTAPDYAADNPSGCP